MEEKKLTIVITTYNRKQPLLEQLQSIERQGQYDKYNIIISNNHSNYDVKSWLISQLSGDFMQIINVYDRPYNVGGDVNIAFSFQLVETQWMWLLSDDDVTTQTSISTILHDINENENKNVCWIKYSIEGDEFRPYDNKRINSLSSLFNYFSSNKYKGGEFIFMSNNVYNISLLKEYIGYAPKLSNTCFSQLIPPLYAIKYEKMNMLLSSKTLTNYVGNRISYKKIYLYTNFENVLYSELNMDGNEIKSFKKIKLCSISDYIYELMTIKNKPLRHIFFKKIFISYFSLFSFNGITYIIIYYVFSILNINPQLIKKIAHIKNQIRTHYIDTVRKR